MYLVAIHGWQEGEPGLAESLASALGILLFEARQRMIGGGPAVIACLADGAAATALAARLRSGGLATLVIDAVAVRGALAGGEVQRFTLGEKSLRAELVGGELSEVGYDEMALLLVATVSHRQSTTSTVTERKFSLGKTVLSGGVPMTTKVKTQVTVASSESEERLWLYAGEREPLLFSQHGMNYDGLGAAMGLTGELNFATLKNELRQRSPGVRYADVLLKRAGQVRLLGPILDPDSNLDLALAVLARCYLPSRPTEA